MHDDQRATPELEPALDAARQWLASRSHATDRRTATSDRLRDLVEAVDHARSSAQHHAGRIMRADDGDEDCRDSLIEDAVALAEGVALADDDDLEYMVCVGGACERKGDDDLPLSEAWARVRELVARQDGTEYAPEPVQLIVYSKAALRRVAGVSQ